MDVVRTSGRRLRISLIGYKAIEEFLDYTNGEVNLHVAIYPVVGEEETVWESSIVLSCGDKSHIHYKNRIIDMDLEQEIMRSQIEKLESKIESRGRDYDTTYSNLILDFS